MTISKSHQTVGPSYAFIKYSISLWDSWESKNATVGLFIKLGQFSDLPNRNTKHLFFPSGNSFFFLLLNTVVIPISSEFIKIFFLSNNPSKVKIGVFIANDKQAHGLWEKLNLFKLPYILYWITHQQFLFMCVAVHLRLAVFKVQKHLSNICI